VSRARDLLAVLLPGLDGDIVDLSVVGGLRELGIDEERTIRPLPALDALSRDCGDVAVHAERVDEDLLAGRRVRGVGLGTATAA
jgi:hypothetical protein